MTCTVWIITVDEFDIKEASILKAYSSLFCTKNIYICICKVKISALLNQDQLSTITLNTPLLEKFKASCCI